MYRKKGLGLLWAEKKKNKEIECIRQLVVRIAHITDKPRLPCNCDI